MIFIIIENHCFFMGKEVVNISQNDIIEMVSEAVTNKIYRMIEESEKKNVMMIDENDIIDMVFETVDEYLR